jgi:hypothetical protein
MLQLRIASQSMVARKAKPWQGEDETDTDLANVG